MLGNFRVWSGGWVAGPWLTTCRVRSTLADVLILLVVGVGVVVLGALVLLLFPDRPGGKITWQGVEVSSIGVGLPLIVVGLAAIAISSGGVIGGDGTLKCPDDLANSLPPQRVATVESGANAQIIVGPTMSKTEPFGLHLTDGGKTVGAMTARFDPASLVFKVQSFVDANCQVVQVQNLAQPGRGPLSAIPTWSDVRIDLLGRLYRFNLGSGDDIRVNFSPFVP